MDAVSDGSTRGSDRSEVKNAAKRRFEAESSDRNPNCSINHPCETNERDAVSSNFHGTTQSSQRTSCRRQDRLGYESVEGVFDQETFARDETEFNAQDRDGILQCSSEAHDSSFWCPRKRRPIESSELSPRRFWIRVVVVVQAVNLLVLFFVIFFTKSYTSRRSTSPDDTHLASLVMWAPLPDASATITKIAFGSCSRQDVPQPYWDTLSLRYQPDLVVLMGDNVYGDCQDLECTHLRQAYVDLSQHASFQGAAERLPIVATLDDHDYGQGDCHADNPYKDVARQMFLDFYHIDSSQLPFSGDSAEASERDDGGVYRSYSWGPRGRRIQLIMLDTRYSRSPFVETGITNAPYEPYPNGTPSGSYQMLSGAQWTWLQDLLSVKDVDLTVLVSSIQVLNDQVVWEGWRHLPSERERLLRLLGDCGRPSIVVSGDRHVGGLYKVDGLNDEDYSTLYEATASSWTHTIPLGAFGSNCTTSKTCDELDPMREGDLVRENHFGSIDIDWDSRSFSVSLRRTELSPDLLAYQRDVPSNAGEVIASFKDLKLLALS